MSSVYNNPLVVDLDGTLIKSDVLHELFLKNIHKNPLDIFKIPFWLLKGKAYLKAKLAEGNNIDYETLPYNNNLLTWLKEEKAKGREIYLCTATNKKIAYSIAEHTQLFNGVIASCSKVNCSGSEKAKQLINKFGKNNFDYVGNANIDLEVWKHSRKAIVVNNNNRLVQKASKYAEIDKHFPNQEISLYNWIKALRLHQWLKNVLVFVPLLLSYDFNNINSYLWTFAGFIAFGLCASSVYIINDLTDLENDRQHPTKKNRAFASGNIPIYIGIVLAPILLSISLLLAGYIGRNFAFSLIFYFCLTSCYTWYLKKKVLIDCITLALLYVIRIIAGAMITASTVSFWLLAFSMFIFFSLAIIKRYSELYITNQQLKTKIKGRGYYADDDVILQSMGIASGYISALVLALYISSNEVVKLYQTPEILWGGVPIILYWISWMWLQSHRGKIKDDPLVFAIKSKVSLLCGLCFIILLLFSKLYNYG